MFDKKEITTAFSFIAFALVVLAVLLIRPLKGPDLETFSTVTMLIAFVLALIMSWQALKLYGRKSSEGKIWLSITFMLMIMLVGFFIAIAIESLTIFSFFVAVAFISLIIGIVDKVKTSGMKPHKSDIIFAGAIVLVLILFIGLVIISMDINADETYTPANSLMEFIAVGIAFFQVFSAVIMARLLGGHISKGWYFLAAGAGLFAIYYTFLSIMMILGDTTPGHPLGAVSILSLNAVTYSAWYQRKKHLELIDML